MTTGEVVQLVLDGSGTGLLLYALSIASRAVRNKREKDQDIREMKEALVGTAKTPFKDARPGLLTQVQDLQGAIERILSLISNLEVRVERLEGKPPIVVPDIPLRVEVKDARKDTPGV